jgi:signal transduction histidine kinase
MRLSFLLIVILLILLFKWKVSKLQRKKFRTFAHDVRNPLSIIKMNSEVTLLKEDLPPEVRKTLQSNIEEANRASEIVGEFIGK